MRRIKSSSFGKQSTAWLLALLCAAPATILAERRAATARAQPLEGVALYRAQSYYLHREAKRLMRQGTRAADPKLVMQAHDLAATASRYELLAAKAAPELAPPEDQLKMLQRQARGHDERFLQLAGKLRKSPAEAATWLRQELRTNATELRDWAKESVGQASELVEANRPQLKEASSVARALGLEQKLNAHVTDLQGLRQSAHQLRAELASETRAEQRKALEQQGAELTKQAAVIQQTIKETHTALQDERPAVEAEVQQYIAPELQRLEALSRNRLVVAKQHEQAGQRGVALHHQAVAKAFEAKLALHQVRFLEAVAGDLYQQGGSRLAGWLAAGLGAKQEHAEALLGQIRPLSEQARAAGLTRAAKLADVDPKELKTPAPQNATAPLEE